MAWSNEIKTKLYDITKGTNIKYKGATIQELFSNNAEFDTTIANDVLRNVELGRKVFRVDTDPNYRYPTPDPTYYSSGDLYVCTAVLNNNEKSSSTMFQWGYGDLNDLSDASSSSYRLRIGSIKTNEFCTRVVIKKTNVETGVVSDVTMDDLLNPSDNYYIKTNSSNAITSLINDNGTLNNSVLSIQPFVVFDNNSSILTAFSLNGMWSIGSNTYKNGSSSSSSNMYTVAYTNKSKSDGFKYGFTNIKAESVDYDNVTVWKNEYTILTSTITKTSTTTTQTITGGINLKFFVKLLQSMGCYICINNITGAWSPDLFKTNTNVLLGELDKDGKPTYNWLTAEQRLTSKSPNIDPDWSNETNPYAPQPKGKTDKDDIVPPNHRFIDQIGGFTMYYRCNQEDLLTIVRRVNFPDDTHPLPEGWEFAPHLVNCTQYPFNVSLYADGHVSNVTIGNWDSGVSAISLTSTQSAVKTIATFTLDHKYNSFLDYSPYAQYQLYIPLCGWVDLPDQCVGKTITVDLATDVINNSCLATINADGCPVAHKSGHMGSSVSLSVTENGLKQSALTQSLFNTVGAVTSTGYAVATQNPVGIVNGIASMAGAVYQGTIANNSNYTRQIGSTGDKSDFHVSNTCYIKKMYTVPNEPSNYSHTCGYPSDASGSVGSFTGYNVFSNVDTSGLTCNQAQKEKIKALLETGVYI